MEGRRCLLQDRQRCDGGRYAADGGRLRYDPSYARRIPPDGCEQKELLDFRLALIAWMVSSHDHSLYEILKGSHNAGVRGTESLDEAAVMYTNIDPLDTGILRDNFAENKQFPHETVYKIQLNELKAAREEHERKSGATWRGRTGSSKATN